MPAITTKGKLDTKQHTNQLDKERERIILEILGEATKEGIWDEPAGNQSRREAALEMENPEKVAAALVEMSSHNPARAKVLIGDYIYGMWYSCQVVKELYMLVKQSQPDF